MIKGFCQSISLELILLPVQRDFFVYVYKNMLICSISIFYSKMFFVDSKN
ncbi:hypothetical protein EXN66_Car009288 [Channa argus]|uniref:Uncharacterized protein n=1 Tax=Channa argus TaxID=215402 RepID=A0A6G1PTM0_CHAAH|nr:hypothetical protein EXN66_Car009288 [Channa argus]